MKAVEFFEKQASKETFISADIPDDFSFDYDHELEIIYDSSSYGQLYTNKKIPLLCDDEGNVICESCRKGFAILVASFLGGRFVEK